MKLRILVQTVFSQVSVLFRLWRFCSQHMKELTNVQIWSCIIWSWWSVFVSGSRGSQSSYPRSSRTEGKPTGLAKLFYHHHHYHHQQQQLCLVFRVIVDLQESLDRKGSNCTLKDPKNWRSVCLTDCLSFSLPVVTEIFILIYFRENQV